MNFFIFFRRLLSIEERVERRRSSIMVRANCKNVYEVRINCLDNNTDIELILLRY